MRCCTYACMHAYMQHGQRTEKELKSQLPGDKIGIEHKNPKMGVVGAVGSGGGGGKPSLFEGCLAVVLYCTVLYKEKKLRSSTTTDCIVNPSTLNIPHSTFTKKKTETYFFDKRSRLISNCEKKNQSLSILPFRL